MSEFFEAVVGIGLVILVISLVLCISFEREYDRTCIVCDKKMSLMSDKINIYRGSLEVCHPNCQKIYIKKQLNGR